MGLVKFVDDQITNEKVNMINTNALQLDRKVFKNVRAINSERLFQHIEQKAEEQGLVVNTKKTAVMAISGANSFEARAHIYDRAGGRIDLPNTMLILGYTMNTKGDVSSQVAALTKNLDKKCGCCGTSEKQTSLNPSCYLFTRAQSDQSLNSPHPSTIS